jgi:hypothetical protein
MKRQIALAIAAAFIAAGPAQATTFFPEKFTCPVGGEKFKANVIASHTSWGQRPDGRPYGTLPIYPIVECPGNGLLLIEEAYSPADLAILNQVVPSAEYQAMRGTETPHYRAWWLLGKLGRDPYRLAGLLLQATWETDADWDRKVRYSAAFIAAATGLKRAEDKAEGWLALNLRAANSLRELGHFDKALALLERLDKPDLMPSDPDSLKGARYLLDGLRRLAVENNPVREPANLIPDREAAYRCELAQPPLTAVEEVVCAKPELAAFRKEARKFIDRDKPKGEP